MSVYAFTGYKLWMRIYDKRILTEDGIYAEGEVPLEYAGSELEIDYNQIMVFGSTSGAFTEFRIEDIEDVMDKDDKTGGGYTYTLYGTEFVTAPSGDSPIVAEWYVKEYADNFPNTGDGKMREMHINSMIQRGLLPADFAG